MGMGPEVSIYVEELDWYFKEGISQALNMYFIEKGARVVFIEDFSMQPCADLTVWTPENATRRLSTAFLPSRFNRSKILVVIAKENQHHFQRCAEWVFYRHQGRDILDKLLDNMFHFASAQRLVKSELYEQGVGELKKLTYRQQQVLYHFATGEDPHAIAQTLNMDYKTVSQHKRRIMARLGLPNNAHLYRWLLDRMHAY